MAPDQTVRGGENDYPILPWNVLPKLPKFSVINGIFSYLPEISGDFSCEKRESSQGRIELMSFRIPILSSREAVGAN
jgi:hypothetical protein